MSTFTLAISCLATSNLPWFMDLTFQVPMQYCSLQHWILLLSPVPSTTGYCFCFGSIPSFFLELFLHWSPVAYWTPTSPGSSPFHYPIILPFGTVHGYPHSIKNHKLKTITYKRNTATRSKSWTEVKGVKDPFYGNQCNGKEATSNVNHVWKSLRGKEVAMLYEVAD